MKAFFVKLAEAFQDQGGGVDLKLILGAPIVLASVVYVFSTGNVGVFAAVAGLGTTLLGLSLAGDQGKLNVAPGKGDPTQGVPQ